jgi:hypothetical protein
MDQGGQMSKLEQIMEVVCRHCEANCAFSGGYAERLKEKSAGDIPDWKCPTVEAISAILAEPDVIVVDGVSWVPGKPDHYEYGDWVVTEGGHRWHVYHGEEYIGAFDDSSSALSAATTAVKGG